LATKRRIFWLKVLAKLPIRHNLNATRKGQVGGGCVNEQTQDNGIRLLLLDDQALFRSSLARLLTSEPGLAVVAECGNSAEALEILGASPVDVVLLDLAHATDGTGGVMSTARSTGYQGRFLIIAETADARNSAFAIKLGASGIFLKSEAPARLVQAIRLVANGAVWLDQRIIRILADQSVGRLPPLDVELSANVLTDREQRVLLGILGGLTNKRIGENLGLSENSVKASVQQLFCRSGVRTRSQLVRAALEGSLGTAKELTRRTRNRSIAEVPSNSGKPRPPVPRNLSARRHPNG
jgi:DNA-binding NarL/FixJ family response regulator